MTNRTTPVGTVDEELVGRLRALIPIGAITGNSDFGLINPDGPEAATLIEQLLNRVERLEGALGDLLNADVADFGTMHPDLAKSRARAALTGEHNG